MVPAVAVKVAVALPEATVTEAGTVSAAGTLSETVTEVAAVAVADRVTVQVLAAPDAREVGAQASEETVRVVGAVRLMEEVLELPLRVAVTMAVWLVVMVPAVAVKVAVALPEVTVTEAGTVSAAGTL